METTTIDQLFNGEIPVTPACVPLFVGKKFEAWFERSPVQQVVKDSDRLRRRIVRV